MHNVKPTMDLNEELSRYEMRPAGHRLPMRFGAATWQKIGKVILCGFATEFCIDTNVRRAASMGLETVVVTDAHTTRNRPHLSAQKIIEHHNWVWSEFSNPGNALTLCLTDSVQFMEHA